MSEVQRVYDQNFSSNPSIQIKEVALYFGNSSTYDELLVAAKNTSVRREGRLGEGWGCRRQIRMSSFAAHGLALVHCFPALHIEWLRLNKAAVAVAVVAVPNILARKV
jgi:hypothetical protein